MTGWVALLPRVRSPGGRGPLCANSDDPYDPCEFRLVVIHVPEDRVLLGQSDVAA